MTGPPLGAGAAAGQLLHVQGGRVGEAEGVSEAACGVNQRPASQPVLACSTGPEVDDQVQRSYTQAGAGQVGSGQATMSMGGSSPRR